MRYTTQFLTDYHFLLSRDGIFSGILVRGFCLDFFTWGQNGAANLGREINVPLFGANIMAVLSDKLHNPSNNQSNIFRLYRSYGSSFAVQLFSEIALVEPSTLSRHHIYRVLCADNVPIMPIP